MASTIKLFVALLAVHLSSGHPQYPPCDPHYRPPPFTSCPPWGPSSCPHPVHPPSPPCGPIPLPHPVPAPCAPPHYAPHPSLSLPPVPPPPHYPPQSHPLIPHAPPHYDVPPSPPQLESPDIFPPGFSFGVVSEAYKHEGAWTQDCKQESIWDHWLHNTIGVIADCSNGDYAADSYNHIKEDVEILNNLTVRHYRFSIPWSAVIFNGIGDVNQVRMAHYKKLIHILRLYQIEPIVTIYQHDLPQVLQDQGGFLCSAFPDWYAYYARVLFEHLGDDVKYWITFDNPTAVCQQGYGDGTFAPGIKDGPGNNAYICGYNLLKAHAAAYHLYDDYYRCKQNGKISIAIQTDWYEPRTWCDSDVYASETKLQFQVGWWAHPIYLGDYPYRMKERIPCDGYGHSRLPAFTCEEIAYIKDTHDFFALNYVTTHYVTLAAPGFYGYVCYDDDVGVEVLPYDGPLLTGGIQNLLAWIRDQYYNPAVFITASGFPATSRCLEDDNRIYWLKAILRSIRKSMLEDNTRVYGFTYCSYIDGFEWDEGYTIKYGLYDVDFECETRLRTPRKSARYFQHLCSTGCIDDPCPVPPHPLPLPHEPYPIHSPYPLPGPYPPHSPYPPSHGSYPPHGPYPLPGPCPPYNPHSPHCPYPLPEPCPPYNPHSPHCPYPLPGACPPYNPHSPHSPYPLPEPCPPYNPHSPHCPYPPHIYVAPCALDEYF